MLFSSPKVVLYLSNTSLEVYSPEFGIHTRLDFSPSVVLFSEIKDEVSFLNKISEFLEHKKIPFSEAVIVLAPQLTYERVFTLPVDEAETSKKDKQHQQEDQQKLDEAKKIFLHQVPIEQSSIKLAEWTQEKTTYFWATNIHFIETIKKAFSASRWRVNAAVPIQAYRLQNPVAIENGLNDELINIILSDRKMIKEINFLGKNKNEVDEMDAVGDSEKTLVETEDKEMPPKSSKRQLILLFLLIFVIVGGLGIWQRPFLESKFSFLKTSNTEEIPIVASATPLATVEPEVSSTPLTTTVTKSALKLQIQNGSGVTGQAGELKTALEQAGFTTVETANASTRSATVQVRLVSTVSSEIQAELLAQLKTFFENTAIEVQSTQSAQFDIQIVTGQ